MSSIKKSQKRNKIRKTAKKNTDNSMIPNPPPKSFAKNSKSLDKSELVKLFLEMLTTIKLYHWNTRSFSQHKATDELHGKLSELVDQFVEVMQGKMFSPNRIRIINEEIRAYTPDSKTKMVDKTLYYIQQLENLNNVFSDTKDSDLLNIRDEMMSHLNQFLYLFSFDEI
jgi:DNA-binding ferritin-like protein